MRRLLQNAATSVLGQEVISYAKYLGVKTINVVRREEAVNELKLKGYAFSAPGLTSNNEPPKPSLTAS